MRQRLLHVSLSRAPISRITVLITDANRQIATECARGPVKDADRGKRDSVDPPRDAWRDGDESSRSSHADEANVRAHHAVCQHLRRRVPRRACRLARTVELRVERTCRILSIWRTCRRRRRRRRWFLPPAAAIDDRVGHRARRHRRLSCGAVQAPGKVLARHRRRGRPPRCAPRYPRVASPHRALGPTEVFTLGPGGVFDLEAGARRE